MGFYYGPSSSRPPSRWQTFRRRVAKYIPQPIQNCWGDVVEVYSITVS